MKTSNPLYRPAFAIAVLLLALFSANNASATSQINAVAISKGLNVTSCQTCHTGASGAESKGNLKTNYLTAYNQDTANLTGLLKLIGCTSTKLNTNTQCVIPVTVTGSVGATTTGASATDVYAVTCGAGTAKLFVGVKDLAPAKAPVVSVQAVKGFVATPLSSDATDGDAAYSPVANVAGGVGVYNLQVNKQLSSVVGVEAYTAEFVCASAAGAKTATSAAVIKQQQ